MIKRGPWQIKASKQIYKNRWIEIIEDNVVRPDGEPGTYTVVTMKPGVTILPMDDDNNVYLAYEYKYAVNRKSINAPSGGIDEKESKLETAKRELVEELGIKAEEFIDLGHIDPFTAIINSPNHIYLARKLSFSKRKLEGTEKMNTIKMHFTDALEKVMKSKISHGATVAAILKTKVYLEK